MVYFVLLLGLAQSLKRFSMEMSEESGKFSEWQTMEHVKSFHSITLQVGQPPQNLSAVVLMDGKRELMIASVKGANPSRVELYNSTASSSYVRLDSNKWYGDDKAILACDKVSFGKMAAANQTFVVVSLNSKSKFDRAALPLWYDSKNDSTNFLNSLKNSGAVNVNAFTVDFENNLLTIGSREEESRKPEDAITFKLAVDTWTADFATISVKGSNVASNNKVNFALEQEDISGPYDEVNLFKSLAGTNKTCDTGASTCECSEDFKGFPALEFNFSGVIFTVEPRDYFSYNNGTCTFRVSDSGQWTLGAPIFEEYLSIFDGDQGTATFYRYHEIKKEEETPKPAEETEEEVEEESSSDGWIIFAYILLILLIILAVGVLIYCRCMKAATDYTKVV
ncbi:hypothetical protein SteCoe_27125 [Stentor coeruleus]|uniref:Peptidase A1 domain-containing protein n=1 Tax=Stentor coeruleus TaxID=5963 RepID=A0A1R2BB88_9CILI|nr:hypothetical protein SteCoe_27125 [Stentor coeruleus]